MKSKRRQTIIFFDTNVALHLLLGPNEKNSEDAEYCDVLKQVVSGMPVNAVSLCIGSATLLDKPRDIETNLRGLIEELESNGLITYFKEAVSFEEAAALKELCEDYIKRNNAEYTSKYEHFSKSKRRPNKISVADYLLLYSALQIGADEFWTHDPGILALSETQAIRGLIACRPHVGEWQGILDLF